MATFEQLLEDTRVKVNPETLLTPAQEAHNARVRKDQDELIEAINQFHVNFMGLPISPEFREQLHNKDLDALGRMLDRLVWSTRHEF